jgi:hypothetical protein
MSLTSDATLGHLHSRTGHAGTRFIALMAITSVLLPTLWAQDDSARGNPRARTLQSATEILQSVINTLARVRMVEYAVRTIPANPSSQDGDLPPGRTMLRAVPTVELAISDGEKVRISAGGRLSEGSSRAMMDRADHLIGTEAL